jgi:hypothetical protein
MLVMREEHHVRGAAEHDFDSLVRDEWIPALAAGDDARLAYYTRLAHGAGEAYRIVTYTYARDAAAWGRLMHRVHTGDLCSLAARLDQMRTDVEGTLLVPLPWSKLQSVDLEAIPVAHDPAPLTLFMEDTVFPHPGKLDPYIEAAGAQYAGDYDEMFPDVPRLLDIEAGFRTAHASGTRAQIVLMQRVLLEDGLLDLLRTEIPEEFNKPGKWMMDALQYRDRWRSRLLRTASWSPLG